MLLQSVGVLQAHSHESEESSIKMEIPDFLQSLFVVFVFFPKNSLA